MAEVKLNNHRPQRGATLIEVMVAIVILAIALLGYAGLTSSSIKYNQFSRMRATGLSLVTDYAERARANIAGFGKYEFVDAYKPSSRSAATSDPTTAATACQVDTSDPAAPINTCDDSIAAYDKRQWLTNVANRLPGGTAYVTTESPVATTSAIGLPGTYILNIWLIWQAITDDPSQQTTCPEDAKIPTDAKVNCMYFRITL
ncbi:MAG: type IV pilus modification protein PilV [Alcaligenaceae bacterium]|nr:MAG: type IV pilus modification protein PilV [Alcaligenaceae bacterium]